MEMAEQLKTLVERIGELPTLPSVIHRINQLLTNPRTSANEVGSAIASDQVIASKVIKLVNSAFYGFPGRINTITHAIVILGFSTVKNVVLTTAILSAFDTRRKLPGFDLMGFWKHSVATGAVAKVLAKQTNFKGQEEAFISGLLHDLGKLILALHLSEEFQALVELADRKHILFYEAEKERLGITHCELGQWLANRWNLPPDLTSVLAFHHTPARAGKYIQLNAIVQLADVLARGLQIGHPGDKTIPIIDPEILKIVGLPMETLPNLLETLHIEIEKASVFLTVNE